MYFLRTLMRREQFTLARRISLGIRLWLAEVLARLFSVMAVLAELFFCESIFQPTQTTHFRI
jgi:hypothetical protein